MSAIMPFGYPDTFELERKPAPAMAPWAQQTVQAIKPAANRYDESKKQLFGIELAKGHPSPFVAACTVFKEDTGAALWASQNWINDPVVIASTDAYKKTLANQIELLDKEGLARRLLAFSEAKLPNGALANEGKDILAAYKLYAEILSFKSEAPIINNNAINEIKVVFVKPTSKEPEKVIEAVEEPTHIDLPPNIKLVSNRS